MKTTIKFIIAVAAMAISIASKAQNQEPVLTPYPPTASCTTTTAVAIIHANGTGGYYYPVGKGTHFYKFNSDCLVCLNDNSPNGPITNGSIIPINICEEQRWVKIGNDGIYKLISFYSSYPLCSDCPGFK